MAADPHQVPSEAEWRRLASAFGVLFGITVAVGIGFISVSPFPAVVGAILMAPPVLATGWVWIFVILRRDADRLLRLNSFAARRRRRPRRRRN